MGAGIVDEAELEEAEACDAGIPHFSQTFDSASNGLPHLVQNRFAAVDSIETLRRAPHFVQKALLPFSSAPH